MNKITAEIIWTRDREGRLRLPNLTESQKREIVADLGRLDDKQTSELLAAIEHALHNFVATRDLLLARKSAGAEKRQLERALVALSRAEAAIEDLGPEAVLEIDEISEADGERDFEKILDDLRFWRSELKQLDAEYTVSRGPRTLVEFDELVRDLAIAYETFAGRKPAVPANYNSAPGSSARTMHGPFGRFCDAVVSIVFCTEHSTVTNSIRRVLLPPE